MAEEERPKLELLYLTVFTVILAYLIRFYLKLRRMMQLTAQVPGNDFQLLSQGTENIGEKLNSKFNEYGDIFKVWMGHKLLVFLSHPKDIELILSSHTHINKSSEVELLMPWLGTGLVNTTGDKWESIRKVVAPTFHLNILKSFIPLFNRNSWDTVDRMRKEVGRLFDCHDYMSEATVEMLLESVMGMKSGKNIEVQEYAAAILKMHEIAHRRLTKLWMLPDWIYNFTPTGREQQRILNLLNNKAKEAVKIRKEIYTKNGNMIFPPKYIDVEENSSEKHFGENAKGEDQTDSRLGCEGMELSLIDYLIEASGGGVVLTQEEIIHQVNSLMAEGLGTVAAVSSFFLCVMAARPDIQTKVTEELKIIFGESNRDVTFEDTLKMHYLERCIMETLRKYPPIPLVARELHQDLKLASSETCLPEECRVIVDTFRLHRNPDIYPNPQVFDPDNFLPERCVSRHYYSFIPFSAGPRSCVGRKYTMLQLKVLLSTILRNYRVVEGEYEDTWKLKADRILKRADGFKIKLKPRNLIVS